MLASTNMRSPIRIKSALRIAIAALLCSRSSASNAVYKDNIPSLFTITVTDDLCRPLQGGLAAQIVEHSTGLHQTIHILDGGPISATAELQGGIFDVVIPETLMRDGIALGRAFAELIEPSSLEYDETSSSGIHTLQSTLLLHTNVAIAERYVINTEIGLDYVEQNAPRARNWAIYADEDSEMRYAFHCAQITGAINIDEILSYLAGGYYASDAEYRFAIVLKGAAIAIDSAQHFTIACQSAVLNELGSSRSFDVIHFGREFDPADPLRISSTTQSQLGGTTYIELEGLKPLGYTVIAFRSNAAGAPRVIHDQLDPVQLLASNQSPVRASIEIAEASVDNCVASFGAEGCESKCETSPPQGPIQVCQPPPPKAIEGEVIELADPLACGNRYVESLKEVCPGVDGGKVTLSDVVKSKLTLSTALKLDFHLGVYVNGGLDESFEITESSSEEYPLGAGTGCGQCISRWHIYAVCTQAWIGRIPPAWAGDPRYKARWLYKHPDGNWNTYVDNKSKTRNLTTQCVEFRGVNDEPCNIPAKP